MASWGAVLALTGFHYSAVTGTMRFAAQPGQVFWSTGHAWGTCALTVADAGMHFELTVLYGALPLSRIELDNGWKMAFATKRQLIAGERIAQVAQ